MKTDLIRKEDAIKAIFDWMDTHKREAIHKQDITDVIMPLSEGIIRCKDCKKHNVERGYHPGEHWVFTDEACPLVEIRGKAKGHEFDYQFCFFAERKEDG